MVHLGPPSSLVQYVQESGSAVRNGNSPVALLLCGTQSIKLYYAKKQDVNIINYLKIFFIKLTMNFWMSCVSAVTFVKKDVHV